MKRCLRTLAGILAAVLLSASLSACDISEYFQFNAPTEKGIPEDNSLEYVPLGDPGYTTPAAYQALTSRYAYRELDEGQQTLYDGLIANAYRVYPEEDDRYGYRIAQVIVDGYQLDTADVRVTVRALVNDNPYLFWLSQTYTMLNNPDDDYTAVQLYSEFEPTALIGMKHELDNAIDSFYRSVDEGLSAYEREKLVHDYILDLCEYDDDDRDRTELTTENIKSHSVYGALVEHVCVCEGYGMATQLLLNGLGVECVTLTGTAYDSADDQDEDDAVLHLWNAVRLGGNWYHVDPTWDDQEQAFQRYNYFNLDDRSIARDHVLSKTPEELGKMVIESEGTDAMNLFIPVCERLDYNYFIYECPHLTDYEGSTVTEALYDAALDANEYFTFYIDASMDYDTALSLLFKDSPQYFFGYIDEVNDDLYDYEIDNSNLSYYPDATRRCVTVALKYY